MTTDDCEWMLEWLDPSITSDRDGEDALATGKEMTVKKLSKLPLHGTFKHMEKWFEDRDWTEPCKYCCTGFRSQTDN